MKVACTPRFLPVFLCQDGLIVTEAMYPTHSTGEDGDQSPEMKMDLSVVKVSLYTEEGILKESQYCTPNG